MSTVAGRKGEGGGVPSFFDQYILISLELNTNFLASHLSHLLL